MAEIVHLRGDTNEVMVPVKGNIVINKGTFVVLNHRQGRKIGVAANYYAYPATWLEGTTPAYFEDSLLGVAMKGSKSGATEEIPVAQTGIFRANTSTAQTAYPSQSVAAVTKGSGTSVYDDRVSVGTGADHDSCRAGRVVAYRGSKTYVDFMLMTRLSGNSMTARYS